MNIGLVLMPGASPCIGGVNTGPPGFVVNPGNNPDLMFDFTQNALWTKSTKLTSPASAALTVSRASTGTVNDANGNWTTVAANLPRISSLGLLVEEARTNLFLNSQVPATQTITVVSTSTYTASVIGAGSLTLSGAMTGTVTQGNPITAAASTTSLVVTTSGITGTFVNVNVELGASATSPIITTGTAATRTADVITMTTPPTFGAAYSLFASGTPQAPTAYSASQVILSPWLNASNYTLMRRASGGGAITIAQVGGAGAAPSPSGAWAQNVSGKIASAFAVSDQAGVFSGGVVATTSGATLPTTPTIVGIGVDVTGGEQWNGFIAQAAIWASQRISNYQLQNMTTPAWPNANNTGVPAGTTLTAQSVDFNSSSAGQVISGLWLTQSVINVTHNNVTVQRCKVDTTGSNCVQLAAGVTGVTIQDCELFHAQNGVFGSPALMQRCDVHHIENGVTVSGGSNIVIKDNYIHDMFYTIGTPHYDGIAADGGCNNITIQHNYISNLNSQTSCVGLTDTFGTANTLIVTNNYLIGAGYNLLCTGVLTGVTIQNNLLTKGFYDYYDFATSGMTVSGNVSTTGIYLDGDVPAVGGFIAFQPTNAITTSSDQNINTGFRVAATLAKAIASQFRLVFYAGTIAAMGIDAVVFGKASSGQIATAALTPVTFGGNAAPGSDVATSHWVVSDWMTPTGLTFGIGDVMLIGFSLHNPGGTGLSATNANATAFFGAPANVALANPSYSASAGSCFALARIETQ